MIHTFHCKLNRLAVFRWFDLAKCELQDLACIQPLAAVLAGIPIASLASSSGAKVRKVPQHFEHKERPQNLKLGCNHNQIQAAYLQ